MRALFLMAAIAALGFVGGCDVRECERYNDCGVGAYCSAEGECIFDGVMPTYSSVQGEPGAPVMGTEPAAEVALMWPEGPLAVVEAELEGVFGPMREVAGVATHVSTRDEPGFQEVTVFRDAGGETAMLTLWLQGERSLQELETGVPLVFEEVVVWTEREVQSKFCTLNPAGQPSWDELPDRTDVFVEDLGSGLKRFDVSTARGGGDATMSFTIDFTR
jgi:hypothetical protein